MSIFAADISKSHIDLTSDIACTCDNSLITFPVDIYRTIRYKIDIWSCVNSICEVLIVTSCLNLKKPANPKRSTTEIRRSFSLASTLP